jgi:tRNA G18 (ribose-2'-O)-methylase SpoU
VILHVATLDDPRVDAFRRVTDHAWLRSRGLFVAEGRLLLHRLIAASHYRIEAVLVSPAAHAALAADLERLHAPVYVAPQPILDSIAGFNFHRGCLALARRPEPRSVEELAGSHRVLGLEGIGNPDNVGGLFRCAAGFGADGVLLDEASGDPFYRKALRTSMAATLGVPFARTSNWPATCALFRERGFEVAALVTDPGAATIADFAARSASRDRLLLLVGAEGQGLAEQTVAAADVRVTIPMARGVDSLNVAVAAGVALSWVWRERNR